MFEGGKLTIDGVEQEFRGQDGDDCAEVVWDPGIGVFTVTYMHHTQDGPVWFRFWAVPNTFKTLSGNRGSAEGPCTNLKVCIEAKEPRDGKDLGLITPRIRMTCRLEYRI